VKIRGYPNLIHAIETVGPTSGRTDNIDQEKEETGIESGKRNMKEFDEY
jgi:hypothetical protein